MHFLQVLFFEAEQQRIQDLLKYCRDDAQEKRQARNTYRQRWFTQQQEFQGEDTKRTNSTTEGAIMMIMRDAHEEKPGCHYAW